jgi:hypothetical protein
MTHEPNERTDAAEMQDSSPYGTDEWRAELIRSEHKKRLRADFVKLSEQADD